MTVSAHIAPKYCVNAVANSIESESGGVVFNEAGADVNVRIESDGDANNFFSDGGTNRVGVGTAAPGVKLHVSEAANASAVGLRVQNSEGYADLNTDGNTAVLSVSGTPALTLTNAPAATFAGNVTAGTATAYTQMTTAGVINQVRQGQIVDHYMYAYSDTGTHRPRLFAYKTRGTVASPTKTMSGDNLFDIYAGGWDTALAVGGQISFVADANWGDSATDAPTRIEFYTAPNASETLALAMTIGSAQNVTFGGHVEVSVTNAITAGTTQTQGQVPLTKTFNRVTVCANTNDVVTLPTAVAGRVCIVVNRGAQTLQIFPATDDSIDAGAANASTTLVANAKVMYVAADATIWESI